MRTRTRYYLLLPLLIISILSVVHIPLSNTPVNAQAIDDLKLKIQERGALIEQLEKEIEAQKSAIRKVEQEADGLNQAVQELDLSHKRLQTSIELTQEKIASASYSIEKLGLEIELKEREITESENSLRSSIQKINETGNRSIVEILFSQKRLSHFLNEVETLRQFQEEVQNNLLSLSILKKELDIQRQSKESTRLELTSHREAVIDQREAVEYSVREKEALLTQTKNKESEYRRILEEKIARKEAAELELFQFESQLKFELDPSKFPTGRPGILAWPLTDIFITQMFGRTADAKRLYVSGTHNGVDFRASIGTPVHSALSGVVEGVGNTDTQRGCYSYGKWILIRHHNGLSTLYAHLSVISVKQGDEVTIGDIIGYSGATGYSTGPHLHFSVYASQAVTVEQYTQSRSCKEVSIPIASQNAYLDPLEYLPAINQ